MKRFVLAVALTGLMSVTALAGDIPTNDVVAPPPPPATATATDPGDIMTEPTQTITQSNTLVTELTVTLLQLLTMV